MNTSFQDVNRRRFLAKSASLLALGAAALVFPKVHAEEPKAPEDSRRYLSSARQAGRQAADAGAGRLLLTHLLPGTDPAAARAAARHSYHGEVGVATADLVLEVG